MPEGLPEEHPDGDAPAIAEEVRRHLGRLLGSVYERETPESNAADRFAEILARLAMALDGVARQAASEFQSGLLSAAPALRRFAVSLTHDEAAADDLVQDTMLRAWRSQAGFARGTNLEAWLFTILRNVFYSAHRKHGREVSDADGGHAGRLVSAPEQTGHLDLQDVRTALDRLSPTMREALVLVAVQDMSYEAAAAVMGCQIGTVKSRVWRAREQLVRMLGYAGAEVGTDAIMSSAMERTA